MIGFILHTYDGNIGTCIKINKNTISMQTHQFPYDKIVVFKNDIQDIEFQPKLNEDMNTLLELPFVVYRYQDKIRQTPFRVLVFAYSKEHASTIANIQFGKAQNKIKLLTKKSHNLKILL